MVERAEIGQGYAGSVYFRCKIPEFTKNAFYVCHGGALTTYIDLVTTVAIWAFDKKSRASVSAKLDMDFMGAVKVEEEYLIEARVIQVGKALAFSEAKILDLKDK